MKESLVQWIYNNIGLSPDIQIKIFQLILIILVLWILYSLIIRIVWHRTEDVRTRVAGTANRQCGKIFYGNFPFKRILSWPIRPNASISTLRKVKKPDQFQFSSLLSN